MTEIASVNSPADHQLGPQSPAAYAPAPRSSTNGFSPADTPVDDESSTIRCFCDFNDDDGNTVLCEECNTWQHIQCYYPQGPESVPELHVCVLCRPRSVDRKGAAERQRMARLLSQSAGGKMKKAPSKSHKKKVRDPNQAAQTNGWVGGSEQIFTFDRLNGTPHDQPPPAKRTKTSHRSSSSTSALNNPLPGHSRKRATSTALGQSPVKSPRSPSPADYTGEAYSSEFMRISRNGSDYIPISNNSYASIDVPDDLQTWLNDREALSEVAPGLTQHNVFQRWDRPMDQLKHTSPGTTLCQRRVPSVTINGQHPIHHWMEVNSACGPEAYIGELHGHIGRLDDYTNDPQNRWNELQHPEPFVFFHDKLPIYIDCREEGSQLRFVRRSCQPNVKIQIIIHGTDFHFCFVSMRDIAPGEEITIPWHIRGKEYQIVSNAGQISQDDEVHMARWVTRVLANSGGCACARTQNPCHLERFNIRNIQQPPATNGYPPKLAKQRKTKKGTQISPLSTGRATNSRANSEAVNRGDLEEDDNRSLSASSRSKPSSRDQTPSINDHANGMGGGTELSDREKRKLLQQERLFEKMEEQGGKKKRNSAGSALNTPSLSTSRQLGFPDSVNPSPTSATSTSRPRTNGQAPRMSINGAVAVSRKRPVYEDACTQTEVEKEEPPTDLTLRRRTQGSYAQRLLWRVREESRRRKERSRSVASQEQKTSLSPVESQPVPLESKHEPLPSPEAMAMPPPPLPASAIVDSSAVPLDVEPKDVEMKSADEQPQDVDMATADDGPKDVEMGDTDEAMKDADADADADAEADDASSATPTPVKNETLASPSSSPVVESLPASNSPTQPSAPPWGTLAIPSKSSSSRPTGLHVTLPPVPTFSAPTQTTPSTPSAAGTPTMSGAPIAQSPSSLHPHPPLFSPSIQNAVAPSPMKKKLSLSDYTKRKSKSAAQAQAQQPSNSSSSALANAINAPTSASSSPTEEKKEAPGPPILQLSSSSTVIEEVDIPLAQMRPDVKNEEVAVSPNS